jgi:hypothetical protein
MALVYRAEIHPTKLELLAGWLPGQPWYTGPAQPVLERVSAFRFDDPAGQVGVETLIVTAGDGTHLQVPLTYRGAPLAGAEQWLIGTMEHSVLGSRWVYDGCGDPVYAATLAQTILTGGTQAPEYVDVDGTAEEREPLLRVHGDGSPAAPVPPVTKVLHVGHSDPTVISTDAVELSVLRILGPGPGPGPTLTTTPVDASAPVTLAFCSA